MSRVQPDRSDVASTTQSGPLKAFLTKPNRYGKARSATRNFSSARQQRWISSHSGGPNKAFLTNRIGMEKLGQQRKILAQLDSSDGSAVTAADN